MITIKLPYKCHDENFNSILYDLRRVQSSFIRSAYQLFHKGQSQYDVQKNEEICGKFGLGSWFRQSGLMLAKYIQSKNKDKKVIFGGKINFRKRMQNKISKEEWQNKRLFPLNSQGQSSRYGNRHFSLDISSNCIIFKKSRHEKFILELPKLRNNYLKKLKILENNAKLKLQPFQIQLTDKHIFISFDEIKESKNEIIQKRFLGIDMNPSSIGISIIENDINQEIKIIHVQEFNVDKLLLNIKSLKVTSNDIKFKKANNKLKFETIEISKAIVNIAVQYKCKGIFIENLNFKTKQNVHTLNRNNKNLWKRGLISSNIEKRCFVNNLTFYKVSPQYSSQIGNLMYNYTDPINASTEIARRGSQVIFEKNKIKRKFYPDFNISLLKDQWKEYFKGCENWKEVFSKIKNSELKYRVSDNPLKFSVFSLKCLKSKTFYMVLNNI